MIRDALKVVGVYAVVAAVGFAAGFGSAALRRPAKVTEKVEAASQVKAEAEEAKAEEKHERKAARIVIVREPTPAGIRETKTIDVGTETELKSASWKASEVQRKDMLTTTKVTEAGRASWALQLDLGWDPRRLRLDPSEVTLRLDRRVLGPAWLGLWVRQELSPTAFLKPATAVGTSFRVEF